jgi:alkylation response protein AidB-like acyl-CoA dehydrogenase
VEFGLCGEQAALARAARGFVDRHCPPRLAMGWDEAGAFPGHLVKAMAEMGWFALAFGGRGGPAELFERVA